MGAGTLALFATAVVVATINLRTMRRVWASAVFDRSQKIAQTVLLWLVPGSFLVVRHVLAEPHLNRASDPTAPDGVGLVAVSLDQVGGGNHASHSVDGGDSGGGHF